MENKKIEEIKNALIGVNQTEWSLVKSFIDMYFSKKAAKLEIDGLDNFDLYIKRKF
ncbi:hypothetical protein ACRVX5_01865 [Clostridioides difficile]|nr:hypothetical protein [Clostridioides difficile]